MARRGSEFLAMQTFIFCKQLLYEPTTTTTAQKMKFPVKDFFSKYDQIRRKMRISSILLKKSLMEKVIFVQWTLRKGWATPFNTWGFNLSISYKSWVFCKNSLKVRYFYVKTYNLGIEKNKKDRFYASWRETRLKKTFPSKEGVGTLFIMSYCF